MTLAVTPEDARLIAEQLADVLEERGLVVPAAGTWVGAPPESRVLSVAEVAARIGRDPNWVRQNAAKLGGFRTNDGPRAPLGFYEAEIRRWAQARRLEEDQAQPPAPRGRPPRSRSTGSAPLIDYDP